MSADLVFSITQIKCKQNKIELKICRVALQRKVLLEVYKNPGPNRPGIGDLKKGPKKGPKSQKNS